MTAAYQQLPADTRFFIGRQQEVDFLVELAHRAAQPEGREATVVISAIDGMAGVGKTALALHVGHQVATSYPDGQLFLDLHGYTAGLEPLTAAEAMGQLLRRLGVPQQQIPDNLEDRAAFYRARLAGTRTLIILDNAADTAQIRPLLPGYRFCLVLVTSRKRLLGLDSVHNVALDVLSEPEAVALLHNMSDRGDLNADDPALAELVALCGYMPLAIRIIGARLRHRKALGIRDMIDQLSAERSRLSHLEDEGRSLAAVFDLSYASLTEAEQRLFRRVGEVAGTDFDAYAAASLLDAEPAITISLLESLLGHNLLIQRAAGRYQLHDLIRVYARARGQLDPEEERAAATQRLLSYYTHTASEADRRISRVQRSTEPLLSAEPAAMPELADGASALTWLRTERDNVIAAIACARGESRHRDAIALTQALAVFLNREGPWQVAIELHREAAAAARGQGLRLSEANALTEQSNLLHSAGDYASAIGLLEQALTIYQDLGSRSSEAYALLGIGQAKAAMGDYLVGIGFGERALSLYEEVGDQVCQAISLNELGRIHYATGDFPAAAALQRRALAIYEALGDNLGTANSLWHIGRLEFLTGDHAAADDFQSRALSLYRSLGSRLGEANALSGLSRVKFAAADYLVAADFAEQALGISRDLGYRLGEANALHNLGRARHLLGQLAEAGGLFEQALALFRDFGDIESEAEALNSTAALTAETAGAEQGLALYSQALTLAQKVRSPVDAADALQGMARCEAERGDLPAATNNLREAVATYQSIGAAAKAEQAASRLADLERMMS